MHASFIKTLLALSIHLLWLKIQQIRADCTDTVNWNNGVYLFGNPLFTCSWYGSLWCSNGSISASDLLVGGASFYYPEFNCCACGKGWPLWSVPTNGSTPILATSDLLSNGSNASLQCQAEAYGDIGSCSMECKAFSNINLLSSLNTFITDDFNQSNCTLTIQSSNTIDTNSYVIRILESTNLIYFSNSSSGDTQLLCHSDSLSTMTNASMICRFTYRQQSFNNTPCPSTAVTTRYIPPGCVDTVDWGNGVILSSSSRGVSCFEYEMWQWCANGNFTPGNQWAGGSGFNYPEYSCCACGKGFTTYSSSVSTTLISNATVAGFQIVRLTYCTVPSVSNISAFNLTCYGPANFSSLTSPSNFTLYGCPLTCFSPTTMNSEQVSSSPPVFVSLMTNASNVTYYNVTSTLFPNYIVQCPVPGNEPINWMSTAATTVTPMSVVSTLSNNFIWQSTVQTSILTTSIPTSISQSSIVTKTSVRDQDTTSSTQMTWFSSTASLTNNSTSILSLTSAKSDDKQRTTSTIISLDSSTTSSFEQTTNALLTSTIKSLDSSTKSSFGQTTNALLTSTIISLDSSTASSFGQTTNALLTSTIKSLDSSTTSSFGQTTNALLTSTIKSLDSSTTSSFGQTTNALLTSTIKSLDSSTTSSFEQTTNALLTSTIISLDSSIKSSFEQTTNALLTSMITKQSQHTTTSLYTHEVTVTKISVQSSGWKAPICANNQIGLNCSVNSNPCVMAQPCLNNGTCLSDSSTSYSCSCTQGFSGTYCETNIQPCSLLTCLDHGVCIETNLTSFECLCTPGYEGEDCETLTDYCRGVTCYNNAQCRSQLLNFTCECLTSDFTGRYCETKSSSLVIQQVVSRSFAFIAILAVASVMIVIVLMDFLKFFFHIDPVKQERLRLQRNRALKKKKDRTPQKPKLALHYIYVDAVNNGSST